LSLPGNSPDGCGDVFSRIRHVTLSERWSYGGAFEVVWPVGSDEFSGHRYQTNAAVLAVYAWSYQNITALAHKQFVGKIEDGHLGKNIRQWYLRALQIHITPTGWFYQVDVTFTHDSKTDEDWWGAAALRVTIVPAYIADTCVVAATLAWKLNDHRVRKA
jgi:hypothetical protein